MSEVSAEQGTRREADWNAERENGEGSRAALRREIIGNQRVGRGNSTRFADTNVTQMTSNATNLTIGSGSTKAATVVTIREGGAPEGCTSTAAGCHSACECR